MSDRGSKRTAGGHSYDVFLSHRSTNKPWVICLARNLQAQGYRVFLDEWELVPGRPFVDGLYQGLTQARKGILVATPEAVDSGWVRVEYETMLARRIRDPEFSFVPLVFGDLPELPFLDSVHCVDFRDPSPEAYRRAFHRLLCGLEDRAPGSDPTADGNLEIPEPIHPVTPAVAEAKSERQFLDQVFDLLAANPILLLLAQADCEQRQVIAALKARAEASHGAANTLRVMPPWSPETDLPHYFARLGRQCGFEQSIRSAADWDDALDLRLSRGERLFLLVNGFENSSEAGRQELAGTLRSLNERHGQALRLVLCGGERLAELKYGQGDLSLLNHSEELRWPELTVGDVLAWQQHEFPDVHLDQATAAEILDLCGGHPRLVRFCLRRRKQEPGSAIADDREALRHYHFVWQLFTLYREDCEVREQICRWLAQDNLAAAEPWPAEQLLRRLYWSNLLVGREGRLTWRCQLLRDVGREVLACAG